MPAAPVGGERHPVRPLEAWLHAGPEATSASTTVLRRMAFNHSQRRAAVLCVYLWACFVALAGLFALTTGSAGALGWVLPAVAAALLLCAIGLQRRHRAHPVPPHQRLTSSRSPATVRGAVVSAALLGVGLLVVTTVLLVRADTQPTGVVVGFVTVLGLVLAMSAQLVIPAWHAAHARELFLAHLEGNAGARSELQRRALADDGTGPFPFGPL